MSGSEKAWGEFVTTNVWTTDPSARRVALVDRLPSGWRIAMRRSGRSGGAITSYVAFSIGKLHSMTERSAHLFWQRGRVVFRLVFTWRTSPIRSPGTVQTIVRSSGS